MKVEKVQDIFLWCMSATYLWAFASLYYQIPDTSKHSMFRCSFLSKTPTVLYLVRDTFAVGPSESMEFLCIFAILVSSLSMIFRCFRGCLIYALLWGLYFSCFQVGQTFLWFQWDTLLIEAGFLTIFVAPIRILRTSRTRTLPHDRVTLFLVRWLTFRLMFASGVVKLTSECPTWWGLTALHWHFESQCIPTPLAWYAHQAPDWFKKLSVAGTYVIEILIPPLFLAPLKSARIFAFWTQVKQPALSRVFLMGTIILTGNYNFFNLIYAFVCIPMLVDSSDSNISSDVLKKRLGILYTVGKSVLNGAWVGAIAYYSVYLFNLKIGEGPTGMQIYSKIGFSKDSFYATLQWCVPLLITVGTAFFLMEVVTAISRCYLDFKSKLCVMELWALGQCLMVCAACGIMFAISLVPFSWLDDGAHDMLWPEIKEWHRASDKYQLTHSYGLFRHMTGVGGRPELVVEGSYSENGPWKEYEFLYKPGSLDRPPPFVVPHQPRVDWQMWFAALDYSYQRNPWFISMVYKLLHNQPEVLKLLDKNPFAGKPPKFIRANLYKYHYTSGEKLSKQYGFDMVKWWWREYDHEYMPPISADDRSIVRYLTDNRFLIKETKAMKSEKNAKLYGYLKQIRLICETLEAPKFIWGLTGAVLLGFIGKRVVIG